MILHMLRWVEGEQKYDQTMRTFASQYAGNSATLDDFRTYPKTIPPARWFFSQWLDSTRSAGIKTNTPLCLGNKFRQRIGVQLRVVGQMRKTSTFRMPVAFKKSTRTAKPKISESTSSAPIQHFPWRHSENLGELSSIPTTAS